MKSIGLILLFSMTMFFCACSNMGNNSISDKPGSREDVKKEVLSLFKAKVDSLDGQSELDKDGNPTDIHSPKNDVVWVKYKLVKDSIGDVFSGPIKNNTCQCEATVYYYVQANFYKRWSTTYPREHIGDAGGYKDLNNGWEKAQFDKENVKYDVRLSDDGKAYVSLDE